MIEIIVGIDVSKASLETAILEKEKGRFLGTRTFDNALGGFTELLAYINAKASGRSVVIAMEATGVYHENLVDFCTEHGCAVSVILPTKIKNYARVENLKTKNDHVDAKLIARYGSVFPLKKWEPMTGKYMELRTLSRHILGLKKDRARAKVRLKTYLSTDRTPKCILDIEEEHIQNLTEAIEMEEAEMKKLAYQDEGLKKKILKLSTIKGLSEISAIQIVCEVNGFEMIENAKQLTSYAGLDVVERQSGTMAAQTHISKKGNRYIRRLLYMPAISAAAHGSGKFVDLYNRINERNTGRSKRVGLIAVARKLLLMIYTLWNKDEAYDPEYEKRFHDKKASGNAETNFFCPISTNEKEAPEGLLQDSVGLKRRPNFFCP